MEQSGAIDVGCGIFNYAITATTPREVQERNCYTADQFGQHDDIYEHNVRFISGFTCAGTALKPIRRGDPSTYISYPAYNGKQPVQMNIYWKDGCILDYPSTDEIYPANPLELDDPGSTFCQDLLINNWEKCDNTGVGGNVQAGCLVYDFKAAHD
ncbi:hypothetical protein RRF57_001578 [Xylaria bambusicola]|uniref:Uncharacterized protein n=1 Tax=Xylaria bambusicola TaxID=326684 RepID=A0AAN7Z0X4_9PEZI